MICIRKCVEYRWKLVIIAVSGFALEWIEILMAIVPCSMDEVSGFALEWIEITWTGMQKADSQSPASRWSGLKSAIYHNLIIIQVSPASRWSGLKFSIIQKNAPF